MNKSKTTICVMGLGYVGIPLLEAFSQHFTVLGYDINKVKINKLKNSYTFKLTSNPNKIKQADFIIIAVPTPVTNLKKPDLTCVISAAEIVGNNLKKGATVILESTVSPGTTEEVVVRIIERKSGLKLNKDFQVGYSPERMNPGDDTHSLNRITKLVAGNNSDTTTIIADLYSTITKVHIVNNIRTAEAAKLVENIQRDVNIALMNELSCIFKKMNLDTKAVIDAAATKWNFHNYRPGLVGGQCIPVDPYYLIEKAKKSGVTPTLIQTARDINDQMPHYIAQLVIRSLKYAKKNIKKSKILLLGLGYKKNVGDIRDSLIKNLIHEFTMFDVILFAHDPLVDSSDITSLGVNAIDNLTDNRYDCIIFSVDHDIFKSFQLDYLNQIMCQNPILIDLASNFDRNMAEKMGFLYRRL